MQNEDHDRRRRQAESFFTRRGRCVSPRPWEARPRGRARAQRAWGMALVGLVACMPERGAQAPVSPRDRGGDEGSVGVEDESPGDAGFRGEDASRTSSDLDDGGGVQPPGIRDAGVGVVEGGTDAGAADGEDAAVSEVTDAAKNDPAAPDGDTAPVCGTCVDASVSPVDPEERGTGIPGDRRFADRGRQLNIMAHQDDELGFLNPVVEATLRGGHAVGTVILTGGNADWDCPAYERARNEGLLHAYAAMAGTENDWSGSPVTYRNHELVEYRLRGADVVLWFMRIENEAPAYLPGQDLSLGSEAHAGDLGRLWHGEVDEITTLDATGATLATSVQRYGREDLIEVLTEIIEGFEPTHVNLLDATESAAFDHPDHVHAALFGMEATLRSGGAATVRMHQTYGIALRPANLPEVEETRKRDDFLLYREYDPRVCDGTDRLDTAFPECPDDRTARTCDPYFPIYTNLARTYYPIASTRGSRSRITAPGGRCLSALAEQESAPLRATACDAAGVWAWHLAEDGTLRAPGGDLCVQADGAAELRLARCDPASRGQRWLLFDSGQLRGDGARCAEVSSDGASSVRLADCSVDASPRQVGWALSFSRPTSWSAGSDFAIQQLGDAPATFETIQLGDIDGDGRADACARHREGLRCARNLGGRFDSWVPVLAGDFADEGGWADEAYGSTVQLVDVNADGRADVCGREAAGIRCALAEGPGLGFAASALLSEDFSDAAGFASTQARYGSVTLVDVDGDGFGDVCGRSGEGVLCATFDPQAGRFQSATMWGGAFSDERGWGRPAFGGSLMFGDVNGDGHQDVCGLESAGVVCATGDGEGFHLASPWETEATALGSGWALDRASWGSLRLADIDGDGRADLCGRGASGIQCRLSHGAGFGAGVVSVLGAAYADSAGWRHPAHGATIRFADLDGDGDLDLCGRGPLDATLAYPDTGSGLTCAVF